MAQNQDPVAQYRVALLANKKEEAAVAACSFFSFFFVSFFFFFFFRPFVWTARAWMRELLFKSLVEPVGLKLCGLTLFFRCTVQTKLKDLRGKYDKTEDDLKVGLAERKKRMVFSFLFFFSKKKKKKRRFKVLDR